MATTRAALARTYRPRNFAEMATQAHVSETLRAAVARGRVAHAYLFSGPRGVGKTTAARVLAMALNCPNRVTEETADGLKPGEPCGRCESCERIWAGRTSLDVVEIDAASNRGVDDARDLRERAMYAPTGDERFKVYIIDEAHMLTREAWNALLKILEEPPPRVIFVFATTEPQKIQQAAAPILSRTQRFDFRRIGVDDIVVRLKTILAEEGIEASDDALLPIARRADGGLRDALSLLDQVLSFSGRTVTVDDVTRVLGLIGDELYLELFGILADRRAGDVFRFVQRILDDGYDLTEFYRGLTDVLRTLLIGKYDGADAMQVRDDLRQHYLDVAARFEATDLLRMLALASELDTEGRFRKSANPRTMLEVLLLRFAYLDRTIAVEELLRAAGGAPPPERSPRAIPDPPGPEASSAPRRAGRGGEATARTAAAVEERPRTPAPAAQAPATGPAPAPPAPSVAEPAASNQAAPLATANDQPAPVAPRSATAAAALRALQRDGSRIPHGLGIFLKVARVEEQGPDRVVLSVPPGPGLERLSGDSRDARALEQAFSDALGRTVQLVVQAASLGEAATPRRLTPEQVRADRLARIAREQPMLARAVEAWDLELIDD
ncbi:MAG TPA: DNA polymerase III subunit gamma/tau [Longimicrobiales bacterium]|nr:DNA polymerase III subunit gamma/tau [Longimicrobiales bacterium]